MTWTNKVGSGTAKRIYPAIFDGTPESTETNLFYNSDNTLVIAQPSEEEKDAPFGGDSVYLLLEHFDQIIGKYYSEPIPADAYQPFFSYRIEPRGMMLIEYVMHCYFLTKSGFSFDVKPGNEKLGLCIEHRGISCVGAPTKYVQQINLDIDDLKEIHMTFQKWLQK